MANSDNVLRGGLTSKHVDVALLRVLDFTPARRRSCVERGGRMVRYDTDAAEFLLRRFERVRPRPTRRPRRRAAVLLCTAGSALVRAAGGNSLSPGGAERVLGRGRALWLAAGDRHVTIATQEPGTTVPGRRQPGHIAASSWSTRFVR